MLSPNTIRNAFPQTADWIIDRDSADIVSGADSPLLGEGRYSQVYASEYKGQAVAVKQISSRYFDVTAVGGSKKALSMVDDIRKECEVLSKLCPYPHIVRLHGVAFSKDNGVPMLVLERMKETLRQYIGRRSPPETGLPLRQCLRFASDICKALRFLHYDFKYPIVHRDISSTNVLIDEHLTCKVADVGIAHCMAGVDMIRSTAHGHFSYMPAEAIVGRKEYDEKIDIYSLGVLLLEMVTGKVPTPTSATDEGALEGHVRVVQDIDRLAADMAFIPRDHLLKPLIAHCVDTRRKRPNAIDLLYALQRLMQINPEGHSWTMPSTPEAESDILIMKQRIRELEEAVNSSKETVKSMADTIRSLTVQVNNLQSSVTRSPSVMRRTLTPSPLSCSDRGPSPASFLVSPFQWEFIGQIPVQMKSLCFSFIHNHDVHFVTEGLRDDCKLQVSHWKLSSSGIVREGILDIIVPAAVRRWPSLLAGSPGPTATDMDLCGCTCCAPLATLSVQKQSIPVQLSFLVQYEQSCDMVTIDVDLGEDKPACVTLSRDDFTAFRNISYGRGVRVDVEGTSSPTLASNSSPVPDHRCFLRSDDVVIGDICGPACKPDPFFGFHNDCDHGKRRVSAITYLHALNAPMGNLVYASGRNTSHLFKYHPIRRDAQGSGFHTTWEQIEDVLLPNSAGIVVHRNGIIFAGGRADKSNWQSCMETVTRFDISSGQKKKITSKPLTSLPRACVAPSLVYLHGYLYSIGGNTAQGFSGEVYRLKMD